MERWVAKLLALLVVFVIVFVFTLLPIRVSQLFTRRGRQGARVISYLMCFGGGVFLGVYMLHMAPDVRLLLDEALMTPMDISYPLPDLIIAVGFFLMVFSENLVHSCQDKKKKNRDDVIDTGKDRAVAFRLSNYSQMPVLIENASKSTPGGATEFHIRPYSLIVENGEINHSYVNNLNGNCAKSSTNGKKKRHHHRATTTTNDNVVVAHEQQHNHLHGHDEEDHAVGGHDMQVTRSLVLLLALSLHHVFEGLSIGLKHSVSAVWNLCAAVVAHEVVIAFSLGMQMVRTYRSTRRVVLAAFMCSSMVPVGMIAGMALTETGRQESDAMLIVNGMLQGLATGVFIYVTFFEILQGELGHGKAGFGKLFFMFLGFAVLAALALIPEDKGPDHPYPSDDNINNKTHNCSCS